MGDTSEPGIVASLPGSGSTTPFGRNPVDQFDVDPYFDVTMCAPVTRSSVKKYPLRAAVDTSFRGRPLIVASMSTGVCAESQSCVSWTEVWKYHAIFPVSTFTAISEHVN